MWVNSNRVGLFDPFQLVPMGPRECQAAAMARIYMEPDFLLVENVGNVAQVVDAHYGIVRV